MNSVADQSNPFEELIHNTTSVLQVHGSKSLYSTTAFNALLSLNILSIVCSIFCILLLACLRYQKNGRVRRWRTQHVSIRLILYASVIDVGYSAFRIYDMNVAQRDTQSNSQANCQAAMFGVTFFALMSVFIRALFSVHLHAVVLHHAKKPLSYERRFIMFCFTLALVLALLPLTRFSYTWIDYDPTLGSGHCSYFSLESIPRHTSTADFSADEARRAVIAGLLYCWMTYFGWVALTIGYCVLVIGTVIYRLWTERQRTLRLITQRSQRISTSNDDISNTDTPILVFVRCLESIEIWQVAKKILRRVAQFPATIIMCHTLEVVWATVTLSRIIPLFKTGDPGTTGDLKRLYVAMQIMLSIQGIVTLLFMCFEPAVNELVVEWWKHWNLYRDPEYKSHVSRDNSATQSATQDSGAHLNPSLLPRSLESMPWDIAILNPK